MSVTVRRFPSEHGGHRGPGDVGSQGLTKAYRLTLHVQRVRKPGREHVVELLLGMVVSQVVAGRYLRPVGRFNEPGGGDPQACRQTARGEAHRNRRRGVTQRIAIWSAHGVELVSGTNLGVSSLSARGVGPA